MLHFLCEKKVVTVLVYLLILNSNTAMGSEDDEYCATPYFLEKAYNIQANKTSRSPKYKTVSIGDTLSFWTNHRVQRQAKAVCRGIGDYCYIFVEDSVWGKPGIITQEEIENVILSFDSKTSGESIDSTKGIYELETGYFGPMPDELDNDPRIYILFLATAANGYFSQTNQYDIQNSNMVEMLYIAADINSRYPNQRPDYHNHIISHELLHLIHWEQSRLNATWINEGCAEFASYICGYYEPGVMDSAGYHYLAGYSNLPFMRHDKMFYPLTFTFMVYVYEKYGGMRIIQELIKTETPSTFGFDEVLTLLGYSDNFGDVFQKWQLAIYCDHICPGDSLYRFDCIDIPPFAHVKDFHLFPTASVSDTVEPWAGQFIGFQTEPGLRIVINSEHILNCSLIQKKAQNQVRIEPLTFDQNNECVVEFDHIDSVTVLVSNHSDDPRIYSYQAYYQTSVFASGGVTSQNYRLYQNAPNPFNHSTLIKFSIPTKSRAKLTIFNVLGQQVKLLVDNEITAGEHVYRWNGTNDSGKPVNSGIYFYRLETNRFVDSKKMLIIM